MTLEDRVSVLEYVVQEMLRDADSRRFRAVNGVMCERELYKTEYTPIDPKKLKSRQSENATVKLNEGTNEFYATVVSNAIAKILLDAFRSPCGVERLVIDNVLSKIADSPGCVDK